MILLWGVPSDGPLAAVERILRRDRIPYAFADQRAILETQFHLTASGSAVSGELRVGDERLCLDEVDAVYVRPYEAQQFPALIEAGPESAECRHAEAVRQAMSIWLDLTPAMVVNRPQFMALNYSKPYQLDLIAKAGFAVPDTLLTTDLEAVEAFRRKHGSVIYKSVSALRSIVSQILPQDEARLSSVQWCPTQFQQRIEGPEVRVHVVGDEIFASEIVSGADDYRYAPLLGHSIEIRPYDLPAACATRCRELARSMSFLIAGIDLRLQGETWYCFEVNPSPGFTFYQQESGQPIDESVARLLMSATRAQAA